MISHTSIYNVCSSCSSILIFLGWDICAKYDVLQLLCGIKFKRKVNLVLVNVVKAIFSEIWIIRNQKTKTNILRRKNIDADFNSRGKLKMS